MPEPEHELTVFAEFPDRLGRLITVQRGAMTEPTVWLVMSRGHLQDKEALLTPAMARVVRDALDLFIAEAEAGR